MRPRWAMLLLALGMFSFHGVSHAQLANFVGVEGHVFNKRTLQPLSNVRVSLRFLSSDGSFFNTDAFTDSNGFYMIESPTQNSDAGSAVVARCVTGRGTVVSTEASYRILNSNTVYRRDFYLTPPSGVTTCIPLP